MPCETVHRAYLNQADARKVITLDWGVVPPRVLVIPLRRGWPAHTAKLLSALAMRAKELGGPPLAGEPTRTFLLRPNTTQGKYLYDVDDAGNALPGQTGNPVLGYLYDEYLGDPLPPLPRR